MPFRIWRRAARLAAFALLPLLALAGCTLPAPPGAAPLRYRDVIFPNVTTASGVTYGSAPDASGNPVTLTLDTYQPTGDTQTGRPAIYIDARNLLNLSNLTSLFAETGDTANLKNRERTIGDPSVASGEYGALWNEANTVGALAADRSVDLTACATWGRPADCVALTRAERRFGNGDSVFTLAEQQTTFNAFYHDFFGAWRFYAPGRTIRIGMELAL